MTVVESDPASIDVNVAFSALPSQVAEVIEPEFAKSGFTVLSNASAYRMTEDVPLIIPEVNPEHLTLVQHQKRKRGWDGCIVTDPNCSTVNLALVLKPIHDLAHVRSVSVTTMQALSGAGFPGVPSLSIVDNVIPYIDGEEEKMESETKKILGSLEGEVVRDADIRVEATCTRVPSLDGHLEILTVETEKGMDEVILREVFVSFESLPHKLRLPTAPVQPIVFRNEQDRPQPRLDRFAGSVPGMSVSVGRIRISEEGRRIRLVALGHNTIRGAAGTSILTAELMREEGLIGG
jgi:aspartate-semialdehyde dehydrogenase